MPKGDLPGLASPQDSGDLPGGWGRVQKPKSQHLAPNGVLPSLHFAKSFSFCQSRLFLSFFSVIHDVLNAMSLHDVFPG